MQIAVRGKKSHLPELIATMENHLGVLADWFSSYKMKINHSKTQLIVHGTKRTLQSVPTVSIKFGSSFITESRTVKNLGLTMDRHLSFEDHITHLVAKSTGILISLALFSITCAAILDCRICGECSGGEFNTLLCVCVWLMQ